MGKYVDKSVLVAEIERKIHTEQGYSSGDAECGYRDCAREILFFLDTLEVKDVDLNNGIQLTWEDIRELYIIFAEVDAEIEFCKCDIQIETIGYYQEVLKRFKERKGK